MKIIDYTDELNSFYEKIKDNKIVLSKEDIQNKMGKILSLSKYGHHKEFYKKYEIIFGLENGLCFTKDKILQCDTAAFKSGTGREYSYNDVKIEILSIRPTFEYSIIDTQDTSANSQKIEPIFYNKNNWEEILNKINNDLLKSLGFNEDKEKLKNSQKSISSEGNKGDYSEELNLFYEKYKNNQLIWSKDIIQRKILTELPLNNYNKHKEFYKKYEIIFGLENGLCFTKDKILQCDEGGSKTGSVREYSYNDVEIEILTISPTFEYSIVDTQDTSSKIQKIEPIFFNKRKWEELFILIKTELLENLKVKLRNEIIKKLQIDILSEFDKDGDGKIDVMDGDDFNVLLKKHHTRILEVDRKYIHEFIKVSSYLRLKKQNIHAIFVSLKDKGDEYLLRAYGEILRDNINTYNLLLFNSLNMVVALVEDDMITFYEIYEMFDNLNIFDSKHEKDVSQKLTNIEVGIDSLVEEIRSVGNHINDAIGELSYVTEKSNQNLSNRLKEIDSSIHVSNFLNLFQSYQLYKINKSTKHLRG